MIRLPDYILIFGLSLHLIGLHDDMVGKDVEGPNSLHFREVTNFGKTSNTSLYDGVSLLLYTQIVTSVAAISRQ